MRLLVLALSMLLSHVSVAQEFTEENKYINHITEIGYEENDGLALLSLYDPELPPGTCYLDVIALDQLSSEGKALIQQLNDVVNANQQLKSISFTLDSETMECHLTSVVI